MRRRRRNHRRGKNHTVRNIIIGCFVITLLFATGYSAFQTVINLNVKGNVKIMYASDTIKKLLKNNSLTMFTDPFGNIRYTGPNEDVHNYVCLVDESPCQDKHLFRIIGSFTNIDDGTGKKETRVKIVKNTPYSEDYWDTSGSNDWTRPATLNTTLNTTYYDSLDSSVQKVIGNAVWNLGTVRTASAYSYEDYNQERNQNVHGNNAVWTGKIALMYPSDYGFASSQCYNNYLLYNYTDELCKNSNWLYFGEYEWLLSPSGNYNNISYYVNSNGMMTWNLYYVYDHIFKVRPTFFLKSNTLLVTENHDGTSNNPYIAKLNN